MIETPTQEDHRPDGLNVLASLLQEIKTLKEIVQSHEERLNNLTIPDATVNALIARTLDMHAQVLLAATRPQPAPQETEQVEVLPEETEADTSSD